MNTLSNLPKEMLIKIICCIERPKYYLMVYTVQYIHHFDKIVGPFYTENEIIEYLRKLDINFNEEKFRETKECILTVNGLKNKYICGEMNL